MVPRLGHIQLLLLHTIRITSEVTSGADAVLLLPETVAVLWGICCCIEEQGGRHASQAVGYDHIVT